ncbi:GTP pyrophosphokinase/guanosine-3',5'-bis(diphosphate) 3'-pyrophosphohydrolase [Hydrogenivirga caldilitoris]|uniref:GTP pyrophosphokinase/guanosine-3',5'-bis(Diphosphate) 3'-pyrophosphohydrolase n=1 Tax=Hydrogenivirga caldilitoris TaxID=246264 RepID=A0A497XSJ6_9AQUI|nr:bifunctional (p)ppGpp synthetase/guanosine-3',5'-bis(diphosphate) 3'-pyrophosphohydrolase [Hydrogenivirga caldilitoris]RLJ71079.1 GTP pyrophosphokinase/guanosine-3',5'-bis(diphosphate) 3'-pyrophosphohydrolase [Hydrogenivirga caldilitoris]
MAVKELKLGEILEELEGKYPDKRELIHQAYEYISEKHKEQLRKSGEPYVTHPLHVARILAELNMDATTVVAGLLHDVLEDTDATYEEVEKLFGKDVADIVEGVTKIGKIRFKNLKEAQAENFRKLILATAKDIRVVIVKLADRLHNMRTLHYLRRDKRVRIAEETLEVYAPIAHRLGIWEIKRNLEDLSFKYLYPKEYERVRSFVSQSLEDLEVYLKKFVIPKIKEEIAKAGIKAEITYRPKHLYSIWQKTIRKNISLEEVHDLLGVRIIVDTVQECYIVLGIIHSLFKPVPGKFKDYISLPKPNLYQSLHTTVVAPKGRMVELQIRTWEMHLRAEKGIAAHWAYKEGKVRAHDEEIFSWLRDLVENIQGSKNPVELLDNLKRELFSEEVFVFTPKGDLIVLPVGATPIDFAYHIHTEVGNHCAGAKVNGRIVPLNYRLQSGDQVEIITSPNKKPNLDWLKFVVTSKAKNRIKHYIKQQERESFIANGKRLFEKAREALNLSSEDFLAKLRTKVRFKDEEEVYIALGSGKLTINKVINLLSPKKKASAEKAKGENRSRVSMDGLEGVMYEVGGCCNPVPGDEIYGVVTKGKGIVLHEKNCSNLKYLIQHFPEKVFRVRMKPEGKFKTRIRVKARDRIGILSEIAKNIAERGSNIWESSTKTMGDGTAFMDFTIDVTNKKHLREVMRSIKSVEGVEACSRLYS